VLTGVHLEKQLAASNADFSNVLCATDLGPQSPDVVKWASQLAADFHAHFGIVHAVPALTPGGELLLTSDWKVEVANAARQNVEKLLNSTGVAQATVHIQEGDAAKAVCSFARDVGADLLAIGRGPQDGETGRLTTHAYAIIRQSPCPVISI
jgi:nucleotide-binding universal stress UspA family protein